MAGGAATLLAPTNDKRGTLASMGTREPEPSGTKGALGLLGLPGGLQPPRRGAVGTHQGAACGPGAQSRRDPPASVRTTLRAPGVFLWG